MVHLTFHLSLGMGESLACSNWRRCGASALWLHRILVGWDFFEAQATANAGRPPRNKVINNHDLFKNPSRKALFLSGVALGMAWP